MLTFFTCYIYSLNWLMGWLYSQLSVSADGVPLNAVHSQPEADRCWMPVEEEKDENDDQDCNKNVSEIKGVYTTLQQANWGIQSLIVWPIKRVWQIHWFMFALWFLNQLLV